MCSVACDPCRKRKRFLYVFPSDSGHEASSFPHWFFSDFFDFVIFLVIKMTVKRRKSPERARYSGVIIPEKAFFIFINM